MEAVIFIGVQASGKSSFYRECFFRTHVRINLDMLRTRNREKRLLETCLEIGQAFVIDNTNVSRERRAVYIDAAKAKGFKVVGYYFQSKLEDAIKRNTARDEEERIPVLGIRGTYGRLELPEMEEGFDELHYVQLKNDNGFCVEEWNDEI